MALFIFGLAVIYSASTVESYKNFGNTSYYFIHQLTRGAAIGLVCMFITSRIDYHWWQKILPGLVIVSLLLLMLVKIPGVGFSSGGATRWIQAGPIVFQPSELAKLVVVCYLAGWISKRNQYLKDFYSGILPALLIVGLFALLILWQPDLGTMLVLVLTALTMFFAAGVQLRYLGSIVGIGALVTILLIKLEPYRAQRILTFLNPKNDPLGIGYQINQALLAIGAGGLWGYGYGLSRQKYNYLPEAIGDSVFAVLAEELGYLRVLLVLALFLALALRGLKISNYAPDTFGKLLSLGIIAWITLEALINIGAMIGLLPLTGIPLPFFSYGSSSLIVTLTALGIVLNISKQAQTKPA